MSEKMLTFEEWSETSRNSLKEDFNLARQGMVPADDVTKAWVSVREMLADPMVVDLRNVEWPDDKCVIGIAITFTACSEKEARGIAYITRPTPAWTPKVGDKCAFWDSDLNPSPPVYAFSGFNEDGMPRGSCAWLNCAIIESLEEIGKPASYFIERGKVWRSGK